MPNQQLLLGQNHAINNAIMMVYVGFVRLLVKGDAIATPLRRTKGGGGSLMWEGEGKGCLRPHDLEEGGGGEGETNE